jgi:hypothetical protein
MNQFLHLVLIFNLCFSLREISTLSISKTFRNNNELELNLLETNKKLTNLLEDNNDFENNDYRDLDYNEGEYQRSGYEFPVHGIYVRLPARFGR